MRLAIIGCGLIGRKRAMAAQGHEIVVVCDPVRASREGLAEKVSAQAVADWRHAIAADIDAAIIATPHDHLAEIALRTIAAGRHVLVEKPGGRHAQEWVPVATAARSDGVVVKVGFNHRFHPAIAKAKALVTEGAIGPLMFIRARYGHGGRLGYEKEWRLQKRTSGGGELLDQGSHLIDLARWFLGDLTVAFGYTPTYFWPSEVEDNCFLALTTAAGQMAWLHASWTEWKNQFSFEIVGRTGKLTVDGLGGSYGPERLVYHRMLPEMGPPETTQWDYPLRDSSFVDEFSNFASAIEHASPLIGDSQDALAVLEIVNSVYQRAT
jgi:predicted dehydrogenase